MTAFAGSPQTIAPSEQDAELAAAAGRALARAPGDGLSVRLRDGSELPLPLAATRLLSRVLAEMGRGNAVTVIPNIAELTTQQAADFLNVSRPYVVSLLEKGRIAHHKVGTHRRIRLADLETYKAEFSKAREAAMRELAARAQEEGMGY